MRNRYYVERDCCAKDGDSLHGFNAAVFDRVVGCGTMLDDTTAVAFCTDFDMALKIAEALNRA